MTPRGSVVVIFDEEGRVLMLLRPKTVSWGASKWALPGGHVEPGETPMMAAVREVREETTLAVPNPRRFPFPLMVRSTTMLPKIMMAK